MVTGTWLDGCLPALQPGRWPTGRQCAARSSFGQREGGPVKGLGTDALAVRPIISSWASRKAADRDLPAARWVKNIPISSAV